MTARPKKMRAAFLDRTVWLLQLDNPPTESALCLVSGCHIALSVIVVMKPGNKPKVAFVTDVGEEEEKDAVGATIFERMPSL